VVETGGLENRFTLTGNGGSNPSPSAISRFRDVQGKSTHLNIRARMVRRVWLSVSTCRYL
jgi:hypothetical protein